MTFLDGTGAPQFRFDDFTIYVFSILIGELIGYMTACVVLYLVAKRRGWKMSSADIGLLVGLLEVSSFLSGFLFWTLEGKLTLVEFFGLGAAVIVVLGTALFIWVLATPEKEKAEAKE